MKLLIRGSSLTSPHFFPLSSNILLRTLSNTRSICSFFSVNNRVSHPYRTTGKIMVSVYLVFLERRLDHHTLIASSREIQIDPPIFVFIRGLSYTKLTGDTQFVIHVSELDFLYL